METASLLLTLTELTAQALSVSTEDLKRQAERPGVDWRMAVICEAALSGDPLTEFRAQRAYRKLRDGIA
jgi:hypothetical protein